MPRERDSGLLLLSKIRCFRSDCLTIGPLNMFALPIGEATAVGEHNPIGGGIGGYLIPLGASGLSNRTGSREGFIMGDSDDLTIA